jgi:hypothetical protein
MPYLIKKEDGTSEEIPVKYTKSNEYKTYYAHGAQGAILGSFHYRIDFYRDELPPIDKVIEKNGKLQHEENLIIREIDCSVYLSLPFAKQLRDWLDKGIKNYEQTNGEIHIVSIEKPEGTE